MATGPHVHSDGDRCALSGNSQATWTRCADTLRGRANRASALRSSLQPRETVALKPRAPFPRGYSPEGRLGGKRRRAVGLLHILPAGIGDFSVRRQGKSGASRPAAGRRVSLARCRPSRLAGAGPVGACRARRTRRPSRLAGAGPVVACRSRRRTRRPSPRLAQTARAEASERRSCRFCLATPWSSPPR